MVTPPLTGLVEPWGESELDQTSFIRSKRALEHNTGENIRRHTADKLAI